LWRAANHHIFYSGDSSNYNFSRFQNQCPEPRTQNPAPSTPDAVGKTTIFIRAMTTFGLYSTIITDKNTIIG
jgi:hypothetical protein